jgi:TolB-like protein
MENVVRIRILGGMEFKSVTGVPLRLPTRKTSLLLAALVLAEGKSLSRQVLTEAFWPDRGEAQARSSLRQALAAIRRVLGDAESTIHIGGDLESVELVAHSADIDVWLFKQLIESEVPGDLVNAADLYTGDVLAGIATPEPLDQWFAPHQRAYRREALLLVERLSQFRAPDLERVDTACQALAERLLATDPTTEEAHRALMRLYHQQGRLNAAVRQFESCKEALRRELDVEPEAQTQQLITSLREGQVARAGSDPDPAHRQGPTHSTPSRGREQPSIIVMPFDNLSGDADEYFVDGVVEEITAALSRVREFFVIARQSAFTYKGRFVDVREIGRELSVSYIVEGTVRRGGDRLRISVQLVEAETARRLTSSRFKTRSRPKLPAPSIRPCGKLRSTLPSASRRAVSGLMIWCCRPIQRSGGRAPATTTRPLPFWKAPSPRTPATVARMPCWLGVTRRTWSICGQSIPRRAGSAHKLRSMRPQV